MNEHEPEEEGKYEKIGNPGPSQAAFLLRTQVLVDQSDAVLNQKTKIQHLVDAVVPKENHVFVPKKSLSFIAEINFVTKTRPRGQRCVLGLKRDIDKERESLILTDRPTNGYILS